jgi:predicted acylesterase/phospholipase RssA
MGEEKERVVGEIGAGESVGEYALLTDDVRSATIYATRDTDVVEMTRPVFEALTRQHPRAMAEVARIIVQRQKRALRPELVDRPEALTLAVFPAGPDGAPLAEFARQLRESLAAFGPTALFTSDTFDAAYGKLGAAQTEPDDVLSIVLNSWLQEQERHYRHILFVADAEWSRWTERCLAQADRILLVGRAGAGPQPGPMEHVCNPRTRKELVLLHPATAAEPSGTLPWLAVREVAAFHHVRQGDATHWQRLARRLTGRAVGIVLSGGAARGLAHIGVARALAEQKQPVDVTAGTSMGALIAGMWARGITPAEGMVLAERLANPRTLLDRTFPYTSVMASRKVTAVLRELFGERPIEDLWQPFFCVSTNLSVAAPVVHERGPLWRAVRASIALPGVFSPVLDEQNHLLVDGGVMNNFPLDVMASRYELGLLIGSNVSPHREKPYPHTFGESISGWRVLWSRVNPFGQPMHAPTLVATILRTMEVNSLYQRRAAEQLADVLIEPDVRDINFLNFAAYRDLEQRGYEAARAALAGRVGNRTTNV